MDFAPEGCPFGFDLYDEDYYRNFAWSISVYPKLSDIDLDYGTFSTRQGKAKCTYEEKNFDDSWESQDDSTHFTVNGKKVNIPSYQVKAGDVIEVRESSRSSAKFAKLTGPEAPVVALPAWLNRETGSLKGVVAKLPERSDIDYEVAEHLIVELYSK